jgi:thiamine-monophosphate kinase
MDEFELIRRYFSLAHATRSDVTLGIGDDAAVLDLAPGRELVVTVDSLVAGVHFPSDLESQAVGHRALAVNLSDLAAMGAEPAWALLALTLPAADDTWLAGFSRGFFSLAERHGVALVGGNLAHGPLNITVTLQGTLPKGEAITRRGAKTGDLVYVTGHPGDAAAGLQLLQAGNADSGNPCVQRFAYPEPRVAAGAALRGLASAAIDISDGLVADLGHVLAMSGVGARIEVERLPLSRRLLELHGLLQARELALGGGDDYELCFTVPAARVAELETLARTFDCLVTAIGRIESHPGLRLLDGQGREVKLAGHGYRHF